MPIYSDRHPGQIDRAHSTDQISDSKLRSCAMSDSTSSQRLLMRIIRFASRGPDLSQQAAALPGEFSSHV